MTEIHRSQTTQRQTGNSAPCDPGQRADALTMYGAVPRRPVTANLVDARGCAVSGATSRRAARPTRLRLLHFRPGALGQSCPLAARAARSAALRDGPCAAGLPAGLQSRPAPRADRRARSWRALLRPAGQRARATATSRRCRGARRRLRARQGASRRVAARAAARRACAAGGACVRLRHRRCRTRMHDRVAAVLPAWSRELPGYGTVLAMHAFVSRNAASTTRRAGGAAPRCP